MANLVFWFLYLLLKAVCISSLCVCSWSSPGERDCADVASPSNRREGWSEEGSSAGSWGNYPTKHRQHLQRCELYIYIALFPASPLTLMKSKKWRGRAWYRFTCDIMTQWCHSNNYKSHDEIMCLPLHSHRMCLWYTSAVWTLHCQWGSKPLAL